MPLHKQNHKVFNEFSKISTLKWVAFYAVFHNATFLFLERVAFCLGFAWVMIIKRVAFLFLKG